MEIEFQRKWEGAHRFIEDTSELCRQPHGHTWRVSVTLSCPTGFKLDQKSNVLASFSEMKSNWHNWIDHAVDHSFMYNHKDPLFEFMMSTNPKGRHVIMPGDPTTEMVAVTFKAKCEAFLKTSNLNLKCTSIKIQETETNAIVFSEDPQTHLPQGSDFWWNRADLSTRD